MTANAPTADVWIPSRYNFSVSLGDERRAVANLLTGESDTLPERSWRRYLEPGRAHAIGRERVSPRLDRFFRRGFLVSQAVDERERLRLQFLQCRFDERSARVAVAPTMGCNLHCPYCFEGDARYVRGSARMSRRTERAVLRFLIDLARGREQLVVNWYGGEPLVGWESIQAISRRLIPKLDAAGCRYAAVMTSNGVLLSGVIAARLRELRVHSCQVSVDVPCGNKRDGDGRVVLERQLDNLAVAAESLRINVRVNLASEDEAEFDRLYRALLARGLQHRIAEFSLSPITAVEQPALAGYRILTGDLLRRVLRRESAKAAALGFAVMKFRPFAPTPCGATCNHSMLIGPDGSIYKCPSDLGRPERAYGSVHGEVPLRPGNLMPWLTYDWFQYEECRECPVLPACAGGCPHRRMHGYSQAQYCELLRADYAEEWPVALRAQALGQECGRAAALVPDSNRAGDRATR